MSRRARQYIFRNAAHWSTALLQGIGADGTGVLLTPPRLGRTVQALGSAEPAEVIAANSAGQALWRIGTDRLQMIDAFGGVSAVDALGPLLAAIPRWIVDRDALWLFDAGRAVVVQADLETREVIRQIDVARACMRLGFTGAVKILDIAADGSGGVWVFVRMGASARLLRVDCHGNAEECVDLGCRHYDATQFACATRSRVFVLLAAGGDELVYLDAGGKSARPTLYAGALLLGFKAQRIAAHGIDGIAVAGNTCMNSPARVFVLDAAGELVDGPLEAASDPHAAPRWNAIHDLSSPSGQLWLATDRGVFRILRASAEDSPALACGMLTPVLTSPPIGTERGWLRAELVADLPAGAVVEAQFTWTDSDTVVSEQRAAMIDPGLSVAGRRERFWSRIAAEARRRYTFTAAGADATPIAIPLYEAQGKYLWLDLRVVSPPGSAPLRVRELRILYPDLSLIERLPAIYRDSRRDPDGAIRALVGVIETTSQQIDARIAAIAATLDPARAPVAWLDFLASWLDIPWHASLPEDNKRSLLGAAQQLTAQRGTRGGLQGLLNALFSAGNASFVDLTADTGLARLGCAAGARLPVLLAGARATASVLGEKTVLGRARLACSEDASSPTSGLTGLLQIRITAPPARRSALEPLLGELLSRALPAGVSPRVRWRIPAAAKQIVGEGFELDEAAPGRVGEATHLGHVVLSGKPAPRLDEPAAHLVLRL